ncbi:biotin--[acetyl-CoA-carboxylase] ligase [Pseudopedobacter beijingensis]|uniref:Biotin--[acetyl-CoA-carboxylase] ligase n=1 Tax=Pseudopedobacter beijingensis TaxID=1207056 RepID=A0ABW4ICG6_9SPHI
MQNNIFPTLFVGRSIQKLIEVDSTNNFLKLLLSNYEPPLNGTVIMAENQTAGRGQYGKQWFSAPGQNLTASFYLHTSFVPLKNQFLLNMVSSLAVVDCLTHFLVEDCKVKWPNDVYSGNKKLCGILIENRIQGNHLKDSIIGIGINVNQQQFADTTAASSIYVITGQQQNLDKVLEQLCICLERRYFQLQEGEDIEKEYLSKMFRFGEEAVFECAEGRFNGEITGIDEVGRLAIKTNGEIRFFDIKEVSFIL